MKLPPPLLIRRQRDWQLCLERLSSQPRLALDLEANSMFAYREQICLIQITILGQDYIVDPLADLDLSGLGRLLADARLEKVFHAAEYDLILMKRQHGWELNNLFDTMWAARVLGSDGFGLAHLLQREFGVKANKRYQKSNWCKRPLTGAQLNYAQLDTHFLLELRDILAQSLRQAGYWEEAQEIFEEQKKVEPGNLDFDPDSFWTINGSHRLRPQQQAILKAVGIYRDQEARRRDLPLFKVFGDRTMMEIARIEPETHADLRRVHGMSVGQVRRYGDPLLKIVAEARQSPPPAYPKSQRRPPAEAVIKRYDRLHQWRKRRARVRGVESDVILSRDTLWALARSNPQDKRALSALGTLGPWRMQAYGAEILQLMEGA